MKKNSIDLDQLRIAASQKTKEKEFWQNQLAGEPEKTSFPFDFRKVESADNQPGFSSNTTGTVVFHCGDHLYSQLMHFSKESDYTLYIILAAALVVLINKYTHSHDILIGAPIYRQEIDTEFINTVLILRTPLPEDISFKQLLLQLRQTIFQATEHYSYPLELLPEKLDLPINNGQLTAALLDIVILLENIHDKKYIQHLHNSVTFSFHRTHHDIEGVVVYHSLLYKKETIERICSHFQVILRQVLTNLDITLPNINPLSREEKKELIEIFNDTGTGYPGDKTLGQLFSEQVEKQPDTIALVHKEKQLTYRLVNERALCLAGQLRRKGVKPDCIVGIILERSPDMIVAILAILKAGGAYLPIEPAAPQIRVVSMLEDTQASLLLTSTTCLAKTGCFSILQGLKSGKLAPLRTKERSPVKDLNNLPFPDRSLVNYEKYHQCIGVAMAKHTIPIMASRGCPYHCAYCHKIWSNQYVFRSAENLFQEVNRYYDIGVRRFVFIDDIFNLNIKTSREFFRMVIEKGMQVNFFFPNGLRGDILTPDYIDLMVEAGTVNLMMALESASPRIQKMVGKNLDIHRFQENLLYIIKKYPQVILEVNVMIGFPTETTGEAMRSLNFIKQHRWIHFPNLNILKIYANTPMERLALDNNIPQKAIEYSFNRAYHELPDTLPFDKGFVFKCQADLFNGYFLKKERLLEVLPHQMKRLSEDEMVRKYDSYLPVEIGSFPDLLKFFGITREELAANGPVDFLDESTAAVPDFHEKIKKISRTKKNNNRVPTAESPLRVLLLDLSKNFSTSSSMLYDVIESPYGLIALLTYLNRQLAGEINGKILHSRIDFDNYHQLKTLMEEFQPQVIGVRTLTFYRDFYHQTIALIRQWGFQAPIIAGGPYATSDWAAVIQDRHIDLVVIGEGEITFTEIIGKIIENNGKLPDQEVLKKIPGIAFIPTKEKKQIQPRYAREILFLDHLQKAWTGEPADQCSSTSNDLAYVIFTSGSTGQPKGTLTTHSNVVRVVRDTNYIDLTANDRLLQLSNYAFDGSIFDIFGALLNGAALVLIDKEEVINPDQLSGILRKEQITVFFVTTALFNAMTDLKIAGLDHIRKVLFGGERVSVEHTRKLLARIGKDKILHMYGPTETTVYATFYQVKYIHDRQETIPIGKPITNTSIYILDRHFMLVPLGVTGQVYISGAGVSPGYLNRPELTAEKFCRKNVLSVSRFYRSYMSYKSYVYQSGDLARWLLGGDIEFIGRIDMQVKIRGFRIEPGEIETCLMQIDFIDKALVIHRENNQGERFLTAFVVPAKKEIETFDEDLLKQLLAKKLPGYMVPAVLVPLDRIPLTFNGKVDMKALPRPETLDKQVGTAKPRNPVEEKLLQIWQEVLGIKKEKIGINANFFSLGGHSLKATILISKLHQIFHIKIPLVELFKSPTIKELAKLVTTAEKNPYTPIPLLEKKEYYPISHAQKRVWTLSQMEAASVSFNIPMAHLLKGKPDRLILEKTFTALVERHESLRTVFIIVDGEVKQKIVHPGNNGFFIKYIKMKGVIEKEKKTRELLESESAAPFDLSGGPLLKAILIPLQEDTHVFFLNMHHIISDFMSYDVLFSELFTFYSVFTGSKPNPLTPLRVQYKDYAAWHNQQCNEPSNHHRQYWLNHLGGAVPQLELPLDKPRPAIQTYNGDAVEFTVNRELFEKLNVFSEENKVTLFMVLIATLNVLFYHYSGQTDIVLGTVTAGREHPDLRDQVGYYLNTLVLRTCFHPGDTFTAVLKKVKTILTDAYQHQSYPFDRLVEDLGGHRDVSRHPFFDILVNMLNYSGNKQETSIRHMDAHTRIENFDIRVRTTKFDLTFYLVERKHTMTIYFEYNSDLWEQFTIRQMVRRFLCLLNRLLNEPGAVISEIRLEKIPAPPMIQRISRTPPDRRRQK